MKRLLILMTIAVLTICMLAGCVRQVETYTDPGRTIDIGVNQEFVIALGSNPTTGYGWQVSHDETMLDLVEETYERTGEPVGGGGIEYFRFKTLDTGETEITLVYKRPWEEPTPQDVTKVFTVNIK